MEAILALEDGTWFKGTAAGAQGEATGEVVFNTSMTGYQEILTDPSYAGQIVTMTCPEIGNYGVSPDDGESKTPHAAGFIVRERVADREQLAIVGNLARLSRGQRDRRHCRHRHPGADEKTAVGRGDARRRHDGQPSRSEGARRPRQRHSENGRVGSCARRDGRQGVRLAGGEVGRVHERAWTRGEEAAEHRCLRLRDEAEHPAPADRARLRRPRVSRDGAGVRRCSRRSPMACFSATAPAIRRS